MTLLLSSLATVNRAVPAKAPPEKPSSQDALEKRRLDLEEKKVALDADKLAHEKAQDDRNFELEKQKLRWTSLSITLSISVPLFLGVIAYGLQVHFQKKGDQLQFKLKAADIVMAARDTNQVKAKAELLNKLFPKNLKFDLQQLDPSKSLFSDTITMRERLLSLLAENPESRKEIIRAWEIMFPWDAKPDEDGSPRWFVALREDSLVNANRTAQNVDPKT